MRASAIPALSDEQQDVLGALATDDADAGVRLAATARLSDIQLLSRLVRLDSDDPVREAATARLFELAMSPANEVLAQEAVQAVEEPRALATIAKTTSAESVAHRAIARLRDEKLLASVARRASSPAVRLASLNRVTDESELASVALKTDHLDVATAALERMTNIEHLTAVSTRARHKTIARRAGARVRLLQPAEPSVPPATPTDRVRQSELCDRVEQLVRLEDADRMSNELVRAQADWAELVPDVDEDLTERFASACERARDRVTALESDRVEREAREKAEAGQRKARRELLQRVAHLDGDIPIKIAHLRELWQMLPSWESPESSTLAEQFEAACATCEQQYAEASQLRPELERLCDEAERLSADPAAFNEHATREHAATLRRRWGVLRGAISPVNQDLVERFAQADSMLAKREAEAREMSLQLQRASLERLEALCRDVEALVASGTVTLKDLERRNREVRAALDQMPRLPSRRDHDHVANRLKELGAKMQPRLQELRDIADWERWANAGVQETLCAKAEALDAVADPLDAMRQLRALEEEWRSVATAPPQKSQSLWRRFSAARDRVRARSERHLAELAETHTANLRQRLALCEQVEALADSVDWLKTAETIKDLQAQWKTIGPVPRGQERAVWERFRQACDRFFTRRHEDLTRRKTEWAANLARKEALCTRAEELAATTNWEAALAEIKRLQAEWKTVGPVRRNRSEAIWNRFHAASQQLFERYRQRDQLEHAAKLAERELIVQRLEALASGQGDAASSQNLPDTLRETRSAWQKAGPLPAATTAEWNSRFSAAVLKVIDTHRSELTGSEFDVDRNLQRMEELCARVERLVSSQDAIKAVSPVAQLATMWREALASNTIGGKVDPEAQFRAAVEDVRDAQAAWRRIGLVPEASRRQLTERFERACRVFFDRRRTATP